MSYIRDIMIEAIERDGIPDMDAYDFARDRLADYADLKRKADSPDPEKNEGTKDEPCSSQE